MGLIDNDPSRLEDFCCLSCKALVLFTGLGDDEGDTDVDVLEFPATFGFGVIVEGVLFMGGE